MFSSSTFSPFCSCGVGHFQCLCTRFAGTARIAASPASRERYKAMPITVSIPARTTRKQSSGVSGA